MNRTDALPYVSYMVDDTGNERHQTDIPENAVLVGWGCGFELMFVAVWSYLPGIQVDPDEAEELAIDLLQERAWFAHHPPPAADFVITGE
jgi:hypothetical protein